MHSQTQTYIIYMGQNIVRTIFTVKFILRDLVISLKGISSFVIRYYFCPIKLICIVSYKSLHAPKWKYFSQFSSSQYTRIYPSYHHFLDPHTLINPTSSLTLLHSLHFFLNLCVKDSQQTFRGWIGY